MFTLLEPWYSPCRINGSLWSIWKDLTTCTISMLRNNRKCKYIFMFKSPSARLFHYYFDSRSGKFSTFLSYRSLPPWLSLPCNHHVMELIMHVRSHPCKYSIMGVSTSDYQVSFWYGISQWAMTLHYNVITHWLGPYLEWSLTINHNYINQWELMLHCNAVSYWLSPYP